MSACPECLHREVLGSGTMAALIAASLSVCSRYRSRAKLHRLWVYIANKMIADWDLSVLPSTSDFFPV